MKKVLLVLMFIAALMPAMAQTTGKVTDKSDGIGIPYAIIHLNDRNINVSCDEDGNFTLPKNPGKHMTISSVGYEKRTIDIPEGDYFEVSLKSNETSLASVTVKGKRHRYRRKDNPAVALMRRVIEHKKAADLTQLPYYELLVSAK